MPLSAAVVLPLSVLSSQFPRVSSKPCQKPPRQGLRWARPEELLTLKSFNWKRSFPRRILPSRCLVSAWFHICLKRPCLPFQKCINSKMFTMTSKSLSQVCSKNCLRRKSGYNAPLPMSQQSKWPGRAADHPKWRAKSLVLQGVNGRTRNYEKFVILRGIVPCQTNWMKPSSSRCVSSQQEFPNWQGP